MTQLMIRDDNTSTSSVEPDLTSATDRVVKAMQKEFKPKIEPQVPASWNDAVQKIREFKYLPVNWDSYGAKRVNVLVRLRATSLLNIWYCMAKEAGHHDMPAPLVAPLAHGNIHVEWTVGRKHIEIEVPSKEGNQAYEWLVEQGNDESEGRFLEVGGAKAKILLGWLLSEK